MVGVFCFFVFFFSGRLARFDGALTCFFLGFYAIARFGCEYFREPDPQLGLFFSPLAGGFTMGQLLSFAMFFAAVVVFQLLKQSKLSKKVKNKKGGRENGERKRLSHSNPASWRAEKKPELGVRFTEVFATEASDGIEPQEKTRQCSVKTRQAP